MQHEGPESHGPVRRPSNEPARLGGVTIAPRCDMKLPESKRKQIEKKGRSLPEKGKGGGALARLQQFQKQRGVKQVRPGRSNARASTKSAADSSDRKC